MRGTAGERARVRGGGRKERRRGGRGVRGARPQLVSRLLGADKGRGVEVVVDLRNALPAHTRYCIDNIYII